MENYIAEVIGTMILILLGDGVVANVVLNKTKGNNSGWIVIATGWGLAVFTAVFVVGPVSGAHINPAVTLGIFIRDAVSGAADPFTFDKMLLYWLAQLTGAALGAVLVWLAYFKHWKGTDPDGQLAVFSTGPAIRSYGWNLITEIIGTWMLVFGIFAIIGNETTVGSLWALTVGLLVWAIGLSLGGPTGYAINPARDLGPRIAHQLLPIPGKGSSDWGYSWVPIVGPLIGAALAALLWVALGWSSTFDAFFGL
ncbi:MAG: aquaporin family protein [Chloroflexota bacterium]|nr:MAG: aquaporin family protein [Chloroflexota bacterium]